MLGTGIIWLGEGPRFWSGFIAAVFVVVCYVAAALSRPEKTEMGSRFNPLVITAGVFGRASLANLQILFFSLIVIWLLVHLVLWTGKLGALSTDVLYLMGIGGLGTAGAKVTSIMRKRLSFENVSWLRRKQWIKTDIGRERRPPQWADLVCTDDAFDVFKFQNVVITFVIGLGLLGSVVVSGDQSGLKTFAIDGSLLVLLGLSQVTYVGGKAIAPPANEDPNKTLSELRDLEEAFVGAALETAAWKAGGADVAEKVRKEAAAPYNTYMSAAKIAKGMLEDLTGALIPESRIEPDLPET